MIRITPRARARAKLADCKAQIVSLRAAMVLDRELLREIHRKNDQLTQQIDNVRALLGPNFAALEPLITRDCRPTMSIGESMELVCHSTTAYQLLVDVQALAECMHVRVRLADQSIGYVVTKKAAQLMPLRELQQTISSEIAQALAHKFRAAA